MVAGDAVRGRRPAGACVEPGAGGAATDGRGRGRTATRRAAGRGPTSPRCSSATPSASTPPGPTPSSAAGAPASARPGENVDDLVDAGSFVEYGPLVIAAQRRRRAARRPRSSARRPTAWSPASARSTGRPTAVLSYDYTVLAGTQGLQNHRKKDRLFELAERQRLPVVFFTEGGGGRPGRHRRHRACPGLDCLAFHLFGAAVAGWCRWSASPPGAASPATPRILGCCDVVIATEGSNIGMGGPAMIEGGGLGVFAPEDDRPDRRAGGQRRGRRRGAPTRPRPSPWPSSTSPTSPGPVDGVGVRRPAPACATSSPRTGCAVYDVRAVDRRAWPTPARCSSCARGFGLGMVTALARVEGRPLGIVANNPTHLAGAIDADGADKAARFLQLCDAFDLPVLFLCDTPGIMVGPEAEKTGAGAPRQPPVRHRRQPHRAVRHDRPAQGLRARRAGDGRRQLQGAAVLRGVADRRVRRHGPRGRGAARLPQGARGDRRRRPSARRRSSEMVDRMYEHGKALNAATHFEIDDVIDPADSPPLDHDRCCSPGRPSPPPAARSAPASTPGDRSVPDEHLACRHDHGRARPRPSPVPSNRSSARCTSPRSATPATRPSASPPAQAPPAGVALPDGAAYFTSRASSMGQVPGAVVAAAFGVFEPTAVGFGVAHGLVAHRRLDDPAGADRRRHRPVGPDPRPRTRRHRSTRRAAGPGGRRAAALRPAVVRRHVLGRVARRSTRRRLGLGDRLREYRGDCHTAAWTSAGYDPVEISLVTEVWWGLPLKSYSRSRAWSAEALDGAIERLRSSGDLDDEGLTDAGRTRREAVEAATDVPCRSIVDNLGGDVDEALSILLPWGDHIRAGAGYLPGGPHELAGRG